WSCCIRFRSNELDDRQALHPVSTAPHGDSNDRSTGSQSLLVNPRWMHPVIQAAVRQGGGGADTVVVSATTTTPPVVVWAPGSPPAGFANRLSDHLRVVPAVQVGPLLLARSPAAGGDLGQRLEVPF